MMRKDLLALTVFLYSLFCVSAMASTMTVLYQGSVQGALGDLNNGIMAQANDFQKKIRRKNPDSLLVSPGNMLGPSLLSVSDKGSGTLEVMEMCGFDVMAVGPHEFFAGVESLAEKARMASFPFLLTNIQIDGLSENPFKPWVRIEKNGKSILFFGIISPEIITDWPGWNPSCKALPVIKTLNDQRNIAPKADFTIVMGTLKFQEAQQILQLCPWVHTIITNQVGSEEVMDNVSMEYRFIDRRGIFWSFYPGKVMGLLELSKNIEEFDASVKAIKVERDGNRSTEIAEKIAELEKNAFEAKDLVIASFSEQTDPRSIILNSLRVAMNAEISFIHESSLDFSWWTNSLTVAALQRIFPFPDRVAALSVSGETVAMLWNRRNDPLIGGKGLAFAGLEEKDGKIYVNQRPIRLNDKYRLATVEFLAKGGLGLLSPQPDAIQPEAFTEILKREISRNSHKDWSRIVRSYEYKPIRRRTLKAGFSLSRLEFSGDADKLQYSDSKALYRVSDVPGLVGNPNRQRLFDFEYESIHDKPDSDLLFRFKSYYMELNDSKLSDKTSLLGRFESKNSAHSINPYGELLVLTTIQKPHAAGKERPFMGRAAIGMAWNQSLDFKIMAGFGYLRRTSTPDTTSNSGLQMGYEWKKILSGGWELQSRFDFFTSNDSDKIRTYDGMIALTLPITRVFKAVIQETDFGWKETGLSSYARRREFFSGFTYELNTRGF